MPLPTSQAVVLGVATVDRILSGHGGWPAPGERRVATSLTALPGGNALNAACFLSRLGVATTLRLALGRDADGDLLTAAAESHGVDTGLVRRDQGLRTSTSIVFIDSRGEPAFIHFPGANSSLGAEDLHAMRDSIRAAGALFIAGLGLLEGLAAPESGRALEVVLGGPRRPVVVADVNLLAAADAPQWPRHLAPLLAHVDYFTPNSAEALQITGAATLNDAGAALLRLFGRSRAVCIKDGPRGVTVFGRGSVPRRVPAFCVAVADTIGAGDAWNAGFIGAILRRGEADLAACAEFGNAAAAHCVRQHGATAGACTFDEVSAFLAADPARLP